jgi:hypothetical protein
VASVINTVRFIAPDPMYVRSVPKVGLSSTLVLQKKKKKIQKVGCKLSSREMFTTMGAAG